MGCEILNPGPDSLVDLGPFVVIAKEHEDQGKTEGPCFLGLGVGGVVGGFFVAVVCFEEEKVPISTPRCSQQPRRGRASQGPGQAQVSPWWQRSMH